MCVCPCMGCESFLASTAAWPCLLAAQQAMFRYEPLCVCVCVCTTWGVLSLTFLSIFRLSHDVLRCATLEQSVIGGRDSRGQSGRGGERVIREWQKTRGKRRVMYVEERRSGGDDRTGDGSLCSFTSAIVPNKQRDCWGTMKMHSFPQRAHSPIWLCVRTFLRLCTVLCICVIMAYCIAHFHRNVSLRISFAATHNIPWHRQAPFIWIVGGWSYF